MKSGMIGVSAMCVAGAWALGADAGTVIPIAADMDNSEAGIGDFTGYVEYDAPTQVLNVFLRNTTSAAYTSAYLVGFGLNAPASLTLNWNTDGRPNDNWTIQKPYDEPPFGTFDIGADSQGNPNQGLAIGEEFLFSFLISGDGADTFGTMDFLKELSDPTGSNDGQVFVARFRGIEPGGASDKVPGIVVPTPTAALGGLTMLGVLGLRRSRSH